MDLLFFPDLVWNLFKVFEWNFVLGLSFFTLGTFLAAALRDKLEEKVLPVELEYLAPPLPLFGSDGEEEVRPSNSFSELDPVAFYA